MKRQRVERFQFSPPQEAAGAVLVRKDTYGLNVEVVHKGTRWTFLIDLFYLESKALDGSGCVQVVCYNPQDPDGDPLQHVRVFPDGKLEMFDC